MNGTLKMLGRSVILLAAVALAWFLIFGCPDFLLTLCSSGWFNWLWPKGLLKLGLSVVLVGGLFLIWCSLLLRPRSEIGATEKQVAKSALEPYPDKPWKYITDFHYHSDLMLMRLETPRDDISREAQYILAQEFKVSFRVDGVAQFVTVPRGLVTDLASVPRLFRWLAGRVGPHLEACIVHDYLYCAWQKSRVRQQELKPTEDMRKFADKVMLAGIRKLGVVVRAFFIYGAVRLFGGLSFFRTTGKTSIMNEGDLPSCCEENGAQPTDSAAVTD